MLLTDFLKGLKGSKYLQTKDAFPEINFQGLTISIENSIGSIRRGKKNDGSQWQTRFFHPYGFIKYTIGADEEEIDCFIGPNELSQSVYIVQQDDEDKVMLGFDSLEHARDAYLAHYDTQMKMKLITEMSMQEFKAILEEDGKAGIKLVKDWQRIV